MRTRTFGLLFLASLVGLSLLLPDQSPPKSAYGQAVGESPQQKSVKLSRQQILQILTEEIDLTPLHGATKLEEFLNGLQATIATKHGVKLPITVDHEAFKAENPDAPPLLMTTVKFPAQTPHLTIGQVLGVMLDQVPTNNASFLIRQGKLEITTDTWADPQFLLREKVFVVFKKRPFGEALEELSAQTGISIVVDPRIGPKINTPVTAAFVNNSSLEAAIIILTNMVGVDPVLLRDVVYITTTANAQNLRLVQQQLQIPRKKYFKEKMFGPMVPGLPVPNVPLEVAEAVPILAERGESRRAFRRDPLALPPTMVDVFNGYHFATEVLSMSRTTFGLICLSVLLALVGVAPVLAQVPMPVGPQPTKLPDIPPLAMFSKTPDIIQRLNTEIDTTDFQVSMSLREALLLISEKFATKGKDLPILVDEEAFRAEAAPPKEKLMVLGPGSPPAKKEPPLLETEVKLPSLPKKMTAGTALYVLLGQLPRHQATYLIRHGTVVITTQKRATIKSLLQEKVTASFHQKPLFEALYTLSDQTGASIAIDPKVADRVQVLLSATFAHGTNLESALALLTDMAGLRTVLVGDGIYVTTPENADKIRYLPKN